MSRIKHFIVFLGILISCSCQNKVNDTCRWDSIRTSAFVIGYGNDTGYTSFVILSHFPKRCVDSININALVKGYIDTLSNSDVKSKLEVIEFFNSTNGFDPDTGGPLANEVGSSFLFKVALDKKTKKIIQVGYNIWNWY